MTNTSFVRKIVYLVIMAGLLVPLYLISAPSFVGEAGERSAGGKLTQLREEYGLSQANLGEIDPASESMKLATLGMRGVAANLLWERANEYKKKEEWDNLRATLNQIAKLQPNFISVWQFQAWNLSYNVSVEFDNYEHRYHWVKKGIEFLMQGIRYNTNEPRLLWELGWFFGHKVGRSDEYVQFRRMYSSDDDFHQTLEGQIDVEQAKNYDDRPDNWLTAHQWFNEAQRVVDLEGVPIRGKNPLVFHSDSAKSLIRYADAIESEGIFGEVARLAWEKAHRRWLQYGDREIPTSYGYKILLNEGEKWDELEQQRIQELEDLAVGLKEKLEAERRAALTDEEKRLLAADRATLEAEEYDIAVAAEEKLTVTPDDIIALIDDPKQRRTAKVLSNRIVQAKAYSTTIRRYRDVVNFLYWRTRCEVEQEDRAIEGRKFLWDANESYEEADLIGAVEQYDEAWKRWATIHRDHVILAEDVTAEDLVDAIKRYRQVLTQLDREFPPDDFPMLRLVANYADDFGFSQEEADAMEAKADRLDTQDLTEDGSAGAADPDPESASEEAAATSENEGSDSGSEQADSPTVASEATSSQEVAESTPSLRSTIEAAEKLYEQADLDGAKSKYEEAWSQWAEQGTDEIDEEQREKLIDQIRKYRIILSQLDQTFPSKEFPLSHFVKKNAADFGYSDDEADQLFAE